MSIVIESTDGAPPAGFGGRCAFDRRVCYVDAAEFGATGPSIIVNMPESDAYSLALLEVGNLTPALMVADLCVKAAGVHLMGIESTDGPQQCLKLAGTTADVTHAARAGRLLAEKMGSTGLVSILPAPLAVVRQLADPKPVYS